MRRKFGKVIVELAERDENIFLLVGDVEQSMDEYKKRFSERFLNLGLCEQTMIGISAGMALEGFRPIVYSITPFILERPFEQLKLDIDQQNVPVILIGYADYPTHGPTHKPLNAEGLAAIFENIKGYFPKNSEETRSAMIEAYERGGPAFISLKRDKDIK
jgi:transketolase